MDNRIEPDSKKSHYGIYDLEEKLKNEGKAIVFCRTLTVEPFREIPFRNNSLCTLYLHVYSQRGTRGLFVRDEEGRELHLQARYTNWQPANPFLLGGEEGIKKNYLVDHYNLPKLHGGIGMELIGETFVGPAETHEERAIIVFSFIKNSKVKSIRNDWKWETKDPDDSH